jgi:predicted aspartyl protease
MSLMGHVCVEVKLVNSIIGEEVRVTALVGAGVAFTVVP